jgi:hypothetical protein
MLSREKIPYRSLNEQHDFLLGSQGWSRRKLETNWPLIRFIFLSFQIVHCMEPLGSFGGILVNCSICIFSSGRNGPTCLASQYYKGGGWEYILCSSWVISSTHLMGCMQKDMLGWEVFANFKARLNSLVLILCTAFIWEENLDLRHSFTVQNHKYTPPSGEWSRNHI